MTENTRVVERLVLPCLEVRLCTEQTRVEHYDPGPDESRRRTWVERVTSSETAEVTTIEEFCALLRTGGTLALSATHAEVAARIASHLLGTGRVVVHGEPYLFLEEKFQIDLAASLPRVEYGHLKYLALVAGIDVGVTGLAAVDVELESGRMSREAIPLR